MAFMRYRNPYTDKPKRHEIKTVLTYPQYVELRARVAGILTPDPHMPGPEGYRITSVYFDTLSHDSYYEKDSGVQHRNKYRIRAYNGSDSFIVLENKEKIDDRISKSSAVITRADYDAILSGDYSPLLAYDNPLCRQVYGLRQTDGLRPEVIIEYQRQAYVHPLSMVRVTFDSLISAGINTLDMFDEKLVTRPLFPHREVVLEVKYDDAYPMYLRQLLENSGTKLAVSKFVLGCEYLKNNFILLPERQDSRKELSHV
ncbi:MAG: polyphosphate polymerase domain-containing protein [Lachnospiraceae bacterium]|nr:polyphosphate polymerase domain-containing protein [Lachnospiraceae bacterium]MBQ3980223.1 polyphosphate polymerase domain-containing protein [Lachnospiraceae bacterium]